MTDPLLSFSTHFADASEADWLQLVSKALRGGGVERITRHTRDGIAIKPLYRETDFSSREGTNNTARSEATNQHLPWDIRQGFSHPDPAGVNAEILRDLERGVSSIELSVECSGERGCVIGDAAALGAALNGVRSDLATVALDHQGAGSGASAAALLALWAEEQDTPRAQKLAFNIDPLNALIRKGKLGSGLDAAFAKTAALTQAFASRFPLATTLRVDARPVHEAGGTEAQELGALMASAVDMLRRLEVGGLPLDQGAAQMLFTLAVDGNYGMGIAKLRASRRLWARVQEALGLELAPMQLQAVTSARMLTRFDPWVNMLRGTAACFAGAVGGADVITVRAFNSTLGRPEELGRRVARNTQIIAMEESGLGRVADPSGGAWFTETLGKELAQAAWAEFQVIEGEGGYGESLIADAFQARVAEARKAVMKDVARRKIAITGISEFALLGGVEAPAAETASYTPGGGVDDAGLRAMIPGFVGETGEDAAAEILAPMRLSEPFELLRERAEVYLATSGKRPAIYIATLGPPAEHTGRVDFACNLFAAGGIEAVESESFKASGCKIAVICGCDKRYESEAADAAKALKMAGALRVWIAGKYEGDGIDSNVFVGCNAVHEATLALAELGVA